MVCGPGAAPSRGTAPVHTAGPITPSALALLGDGASSTVRPVERSFARGRPRLASTAGKLIAAGTLSRKRPSGIVYQRLAGAWTMKMGFSARPAEGWDVVVGTTSGDLGDGLGL